MSMLMKKRKQVKHVLKCCSGRNSEVGGVGKGRSGGRGDKEVKDHALSSQMS